MSTTTSADKHLPYDLGPQSATVKSRCPVIEINEWSRSSGQTLPEGFTPLDDLVAKSESDPKRRIALEKARNWLANTLTLDAQQSLRALRLKQGLSQANLASRVGTTQAQIARIESGQQDVLIGTVLRIANALGVDHLSALRAFLAQRKDER